MGAYYFNQTVGVDDNQDNMIESEIVKNYPNPFNNITSISYALQHPSFVKLQIYNIKGQLVGTLINEHKPAGYHTVEWNAKDMSSGIYLYKLTTQDKTFIKKMIILH
ncbi:MAG: T9SS type A sorting domain-containing protein [Candidatus Cloacimonetes bacterium]|nr:T9SS type A sorting domain-containing protein [Candidatus Cloacimonadota bacterium]